MAEDPFRRVADAPLFVVPRMLEALHAFLLTLISHV